MKYSLKSNILSNGILHACILNICVCVCGLVLITDFCKSFPSKEFACRRKQPPKSHSSSYREQLSNVTHTHTHRHLGYTYTCTHAKWHSNAVTRATNIKIYIQPSDVFIYPSHVSILILFLRRGSIWHFSPSSGIRPTLSTTSVPSLTLPPTQSCYFGLPAFLAIHTQMSRALVSLPPSYGRWLWKTQSRRTAQNERALWLTYDPQGKATLDVCFAPGTLLHITWHAHVTWRSALDRQMTVFKLKPLLLALLRY